MNAVTKRLRIKNFKREDGVTLVSEKRTLKVEASKAKQRGKVEATLRNKLSLNC